MNNLYTVRRGLELLERVGATSIALDHDAIYAGGNRLTPDDLDVSALEELDELGWVWDEVSDSWMRFV